MDEPTHTATEKLDSRADHKADTRPIATSDTPAPVRAGDPTRKKGDPLPLSKEEDIEHTQPSKLLFFGDGIYVRVNKRGDKKSFRVRISLGGKDKWETLGIYPDMNLSQAREKAKTKRGEVGNIRQKKADAAWSVFLTKNSEIKRKKKDESEEYPSFKGMEDAGAFIRNLFEYKDSDEIRLAIWLQMLIPSRTSELLCAKWKDVDGNSSQWTIDKNEKTNENSKSWVPPQVEHLSQSARAAFDELHKLTGTSDYLFPSLFRMTKAGRDKTIAQAIERIGLNYPIEPGMFRNFFRSMATKYSFFNPEFIEAMITHKHVNGSIYNFPYYNRQRCALAEWWGDELMRLSNKSHSLF